MTSGSYELKFTNTETLHKENDAEFNNLPRDVFKKLELTQKNYKVYVVNPENKADIASFSWDKLTYGFDETEKVVKLFRAVKMTKSEQYNVLMEVRIEDEKEIKGLMDLLTRPNKTINYKDPLAVTPSRKERASILSEESPRQNFRGFVNLAIIILVITNFRLILENFLKYGFLIKWVDPVAYMQNSRDYPCMTTALSLNLFVLLANQIQKLGFSDKKWYKRMALLNWINIIGSLLIPYLVVHRTEPMPIPALMLLSLSVVLCLKLISYSHVMGNVYKVIQKLKKLEENKSTESLPENEISSENKEILLKYIENPSEMITLRNIYYFMAAPTLCYQLYYPYRPKIRKIWLFKRVIEFIVVMSLQTFIFFQYVEPIVENSVPHMKNRSFIQMAERLLKLSIPNIYCWILGFFGFFHLWLNILGEIIGFADREFYEDWWNCKNLDEYWRLWNLPVHFWFIRHVYNPLLKKGVSKSNASLVVFFISAVAHEYLVSASIGIWSFWAFLGMMIQAPIMRIQRQTDKILKDSQIGNVTFWVSFCVIGQPACVFIYYYLYITKIFSA